MQLSPGQMFHHRWCAALAAQDVAALQTLYHPAAVQVSTVTGKVLAGTEQITDSFRQLFAVAGAVTTTAVESFVDAGELICVESVQATAYAKALTYDVFLLEEGRLRHHVNGSISPRPQAPSLNPADPPTPGQALYRRFWGAVGAQDQAGLASVYTPDIVQVTVGDVVRGRDAVLAGAGQMWQTVGPSQLKGVTQFVETPEVVCVEGVADIGGRQMNLDVMFYEVWLLRAGLVGHRVNGLISPRPDQLRQGMQRLAQHQSQLLQTFTEGVTLRAAAPWRW